MTDTRPDIIVAVDFGTTYTGVAWARPQRFQALQSPIQILHNWPGVSSRNEQKVQTCLVYNKDQSLSSWGYLCDDDDDDSPDKSRREFFKAFLDRQTFEAKGKLVTSQIPGSASEAQKLIIDYLKEVYAHVKATVELQTGISHMGWKTLTVEFIFSVPTTWRSQDVINTFKHCIKAAGFGVEGERHSATVELTESEAAAVGTIKSSTVDFTSGDIFLSVDAGGGTTDFALMQVVQARQPFPSLSQINQVDGVGIGSTLIDQAFVAFVKARLGMFPELIGQIPPDCAERLVKSDRFKTTKHKFGEKVYQSNCYKLTLDGVPFNFSHEAAGIELGKIIIYWEEMQRLFDPHARAILQKIREQLDWMQARGIDRQIRYLILSGGLGSSAYVRNWLQAELSINPHPYARQVKIVQAPDPQLVVVRGLLLDRLQSLEATLAPVIVGRIARASYGIVCKRKYNPEIDTDEEVRKDAYDGVLYVMGQIEWIIKKGDYIVPNKPIIQTFTYKLDAKDATRSWDSIIMISDLDRGSLPIRVNQEGVKQLCVIKSDLTGVQHEDMIKQRSPKRLFFRGSKFYLCTFEVHAIVAPAEIRFELWFAGQRYAGNHDPIKITWDDEGTKVGR
ncbi:hypothetical protein GGS20DRAFT_563476 [Poronia punctata]|nr:hypothetical protein GGS20DRAFT_563476 [Poronia punctata]